MFTSLYTHLYRSAVFKLKTACNGALVTKYRIVTFIVLHDLLKILYNDIRGGVRDTLIHFKRVYIIPV